MKKVLFVFCFIISVAQTYSQTALNRYERFHAGKYVYSEINNGSYSIRTEKQQKSFYPDGLTNTFDIKWANDSVFTLVFVESNRTDAIFKKGDEIIVWITSAKDSCYTCSTFFKGTRSQEIKMCKVEEK